MYKNHLILATICARGGSKGIKYKNIRKLNGKPLICYSLDLIRRSKIIDNYIISTDSKKIMDVVEDYNFNIHFTRPEELAQDKVSRIEVIKHATQWAETNFKKKYDIVVDLGVATPLKNIDDMENAIKMLVDSEASNVFSVNIAHKNPYFNMVEERKGRVCIVKEISKDITDRRDSPKVYEMNDGLNIFKHDILFSLKPQFNENTKIYIMPFERSIDIDEETDLLLAEFLISKQKNGSLVS